MNNTKAKEKIEQVLSDMKDSNLLFGIRIEEVINDLESSNQETKLNALNKIAFIRKQAEVLQNITNIPPEEVSSESLSQALNKKVKRLDTSPTAIVSPALILEQGVVFTSENVVEINKEEQLQQVGIDLRLASASRVVGNATLTIDKAKTEKPQFVDMQVTNGFYLFKAGELYSLDFYEDVKVPENMAGIVKHRSTINRTIGTIESGIYDPGFESLGGCGAVFRPNTDVKIEVGFRMAQIVFYTAASANLYDGQYQGS